MRKVLVALFVVVVVVAIAQWFWPRPVVVPVVVPSVDPRLEHHDVDAGVVADGNRFAAALTGHRGRLYFGDLDAIRERGVLRVLTRNNASGYFLYRGVERGFDFELAERFAKQLGVRLEMVVAPTRRDLIPWLLEGRGDVVIAGMSLLTPRADRVRFSIPYQDGRWVVVVPRSGPAAKDMPKISTVDDLGLVSLLVRPSSSALARLRTLAVPGGLTLVAAVESLESEDLLDEIRLKGKTAAVVEERVARLELLHRRDLQIALVLDGDDSAGMASRKEDTALAAALDAFITANRGSSDWVTTYRRYHESRSATAAYVSDRSRADKDGRLTPYDDTFKAAAARVDVKSPPGLSADGGDDVALDWRLLAAVAVQESRLDPHAQSGFGARGLMQLLPSTATENGCDDPLDPPCAVNAAARYLARLARQESKAWRPLVVVTDPVDGGFARAPVDPAKSVAFKDRVRFALASYNSGAGHVDDARDLAAREGLDPDRWFGHVEQAMLLLEKPRYYATTKHGYARATETVAYVSEIQSRFDAYVALTDAP
ncbi:MAG: transporter substrate-binding domain-containing protein [Deltaproteobacteria bacterium]|nr:transporter substrate-binding domain-containing protein [Deltaproteobacteria bacterium]